jgi:hypothetical protein
MEYLNGWTKEKVIDQLNQEFKGVAYNDLRCQCSYRAGNKKCVAGCFIPNDLYTSSMEGIYIDTLMSSNKDISNSMPFGSLVMKTWQDIHDNIDSSLPLEDQMFELISFLDKDVQ